MKLIETQKIPIRMWLEEIEDGAMEQIKHLADLPFAFSHIAIMPDSHQGYGMPIGGVLATKDVIIPNAVGVDIGCGMCAVKTSITEIDTETLKKIMGEIRKVIPVGFKKHEEEQAIELMPFSTNGYSEVGEFLPILRQEYSNARKSLGTLGGGNHFIEIQKGSDRHIWIMIHSGSRNLGKQVADFYNKVAIELNKKWFSAVPEEWELAFLPVDSEEGQAYIREMQYCVDFALANRKLMMDRIKKIFTDILGIDNGETGVGFCSWDGDSKIEFKEEMINIAHNYAKLENHLGHNVWIHRKGATLADKDTIGIIPGSQGTKSYIVKGKGNVLSFKSCSHGAGRKMGRNDAVKNLNLEDEIRKLDDQGIIHGIRHQNDLDEASGAYKPIDEVMRNQSDLVEILIELSPLAVIKG
jgi:tRNA-splicing ligase RtcB